MKKILTVLFVLALVLSPGVITAVTAAASNTTWYVVEGGTGDETGLSWDTAFADIQDAVDAASDGDTIKVATGKHGAFSVIGKANIVISGDDGATVIAGDSVPINRGPIGEAWCMAVVKDSHNISILGIGFDGSGLGREEVVVGIAYIDSTGEVAHITVEKIVGVQLGAGVVIIGDAETSDVSLKDVTVERATVGVVISAARASLDSCTFTAMVPGAGFGIIPMPIGIGVLVGLPDEQTVATQSEFGGYGSSPTPHHTRVQMGGSTVSNSDIGMLVIDDSIVEAHFNRIVDNVWFGLRNDGGQPVNATNNWWGRSSGPYEPVSNPGGEGNAVSGEVDYRPWLRADVGVVKIQTVEGEGTVDAKLEADTEVKVSGTATVIVTVARYDGDPRGDAVTSFDSSSGTSSGDLLPLNNYIDLNVRKVYEDEDLTMIEVRLYYFLDDVTAADIDERTLVLHYLDDGNEWVKCQETGVTVNRTVEYGGYIWAKIRAGHTAPSLDDDLGGTPFGGYGSSPGVPQPPCAIATAAYGTDKAQEIEILREFRDAVLLANSTGAALVYVYYRTSPAVADFISRYEILRAAVRLGVVDPIMAALNWSQAWWSVTGR